MMSSLKASTTTTTTTTTPDDEVDDDDDDDDSLFYCFKAPTTRSTRSTTTPTTTDSTALKASAAPCIVQTARSTGDSDHVELTRIMTMGPSGYSYYSGAAREQPLQEAMENLTAKKLHTRW